MRLLCALSAILCCYCIPIYGQSIADSIDFYEGKALQAYDVGMYEQAHELYMKIADAVRDHNKAKYPEMQNNLGNIAAYAGRTEDAISYYQEALRNMSFAKFPEAFESKVYKNISAVYSDLKDFATAMRYLEKSETIAKRIDNDELIADCLNNKAIIYEQLDSIEKALSCYEEALISYQRIGNPERLALVHINLAVISKNLKKYELAKKSSDSALHYSYLIGNDFYISATLNNLGNVLSGMGRHKEAIENTQKALALARKIGQPDLAQNCMSSLADQYFAMGDHKNAFIWMQKFVALHDSIVNTERVTALMELETKYGLELKEKELDRIKAVSNLAIEEKKRAEANSLLLGLGLVIIAVSSVGWMKLRDLKQKKAELELIAITENRERERIAKDMHDELGSGISRITWITSTLERQVDDEQAKAQLTMIEQLADQLSSSLKSLIWLINTGNVQADVFVSRIRELAAEMAEERGWQLTFTVSHLTLHEIIRQNAARDLILVCKEVLNNISKYAAAKNTAVRMSMENNLFILDISDDGIGFDTQKKSSGHGTQNIKRRAKDLGGIAELQSEIGKGTHWSLRIPATSVILD